MKKIFFIISILFISICSTMQAQCFDYCWEDDCHNFYVEILGGANFLQSQKHDDIKYSFNTGYIVAGSLGYRLCYGFRIEFEYAYRRNEIEKIHGHFQSSSFMGNLLWDLPLCGFCGIQPFVGAGVGSDIQRLHANDVDLHKSKNVAWQIMAGLSYPLFCNTDISLEYEFHKGGLSFIECHSVGVGLTYNF